MAGILSKVLHFASPCSRFSASFDFAGVWVCLDALAGFLVLQAVGPDFVQVFDFAGVWVCLDAFASLGILGPWSSFPGRPCILQGFGFVWMLVQKFGAQKTDVSHFAKQQCGFPCKMQKFGSGFLNILECTAFSPAKVGHGRFWHVFHVSKDARDKGHQKSEAGLFILQGFSFHSFSILFINFISFEAMFCILQSARCHFFNLLAAKCKTQHRPDYFWGYPKSI